MSTPAQNPRPSARRMTTRLSGTRPAARTASARPNQPATSSALTGGMVDDDLGDAGPVLVGGDGHVVLRGLRRVPPARPARRARRGAGHALGVARRAGCGHRRPASRTRSGFGSDAVSGNSGLDSTSRNQGGSSGSDAGAPTGGDPLDFHGRVGWSSPAGHEGIGRGIAEAFLAAGADVVVCGRTDGGRRRAPGGDATLAGTGAPGRLRGRRPARRRPGGRRGGGRRRPVRSARRAGEQRRGLADRPTPPRRRRGSRRPSST